jgi:hypothetical protein
MKLDIRQFQAPITVNDVTDEVKSRNASSSLPVVIDHVPDNTDLKVIEQWADNFKVPLALRNVDLTAINSKSALLAVLTHNLPRNEYNMPKILYRPDVLDYTVFHTDATPSETEAPAETSETPEEPVSVPPLPTRTDFSTCARERTEAQFKLMQDLLDASTIILDYHEGYPSYLNTPIWKQFPWESIQDYDLFTRYLELPGARQLAVLGIEESKTAGELFHTNYWGLRCLASDTFAVVHYKRMRERRILQTDDVHFLESERILRLLIKQIAEVKWDVLQDDPKTFVEVLERVAKIQRAALGTTERKNDDNQGIPSVELIMRKSAEHMAPLSQNEDVGGVDISKLLRDPKSVQDAQELILRIGGQSRD